LKTKRKSSQQLQRWPFQENVEFNLLEKCKDHDNKMEVISIARGRNTITQPGKINMVRRSARTSFTHHPQTEKQGVWIHRSINTEVTTVDLALGQLLKRGLRRWG
jgi:hypothetical protein